MRKMRKERIVRKQIAKGKMRKIIGLSFAAMLALTPQSASVVSATEMVQETEYAESGEDGDVVVIEKEDKPYLALGADLSDAQRSTVLSLMGLSAAELSDYDVVYVNNTEEHQYLGEYISSAEIGKRSLSSVVITRTQPGEGLHISTYNINYCTVGMYKNALATAGISDANIIVAGPFEISGTAALVGVLKAYQEITGEELKAEVVDAAMDELVTTGELNESIEGDSQDIEAMIAELKEKIGDKEIVTDEQILEAIKSAAEKYQLKLTDADKDKLLQLLKKLQETDIDWELVKDQAADWAQKFNHAVEEKLSDEDFGSKLAGFFRAIIDFFKNLFA